MAQVSCFWLLSALHGFPASSFNLYPVKYKDLIARSQMVSRLFDFKGGLSTESAGFEPGLPVSAPEC